jgi:hypothetical protein
VSGEWGDVWSADADGVCGCVSGEWSGEEEDGREGGGGGDGGGVGDCGVVVGMGWDDGMECMNERDSGWMMTGWLWIMMDLLHSYGVVGLFGSG